MRWDLLQCAKSSIAADSVYAVKQISSPHLYSEMVLEPDVIAKLINDLLTCPYL